MSTGRVRVGYAHVEQDVIEGHFYSNGVTREVWRAGGLAPRMPSDGSCGCKRVRQERAGREAKVVLLCPAHGVDPDIARYCLSEGITKS